MAWRKVQTRDVKSNCSQGLIDNSEGCGENFLHKGIMLTQL
jgi:hypothetical protein